MQSFGKFKVNPSISPLTKGGLRGVFGVGITLLLLLAVACGAAATATPVAKPAAKPVAPAAAQPAAPAAPAVAPTATPAPAAKPAPTRPKVERLVVSVVPPIHETTEPSLSTPPGLLPLLPMYEYLVEVDQLAKLKPMLATEWSMAPDAKQWTFKLRRGVPWHRGFGEFTGKDVVHSMARASRQESLLPFASLWRDVLDRIEVVDDYQTVFQLKRPHAELLENVLSTWDMMILSKAHWDAEGQKGVLEKPVGTGPYQIKEIKTGSHKLYERVDKHYRATPDFREIQISFVPEDSTRLATLLAGEAHIAEIPTAIQSQAEAKGMKVVFSTVPAIQLLGVYGGNHQLTPAKFDPKVPFTNKQVRQALNLAINRKEMNDTLYSGRGKIMTNGLYHPSLAGWNPDWEKRFNELYGYNPTKAKELLAQAGYPKGFKTTFRLFPRPGVPAMVEVGEAIALYWQRIGVEVALETTEFAKVRDDYRDWRGQGMSWLHGFPPQAPWNIVPVFTGNPVARGVVRSFENELVTQKMKQLDVAVDPQERDRFQREMGNVLFDEFAHIPLFWLAAEFTVNPKFIAEYVTTGHFGPRHLEYLQAVK